MSIDKRDYQNSTLEKKLKFVKEIIKPRAAE